MYTYPLTIQGTLQFDPEPKISTKSNTKQSPWWLILKISDEWVRYYQWLLFRALNIKVQKPFYGAHISVIRGEEPTLNKACWGSLEGVVMGAAVAVSMRSTEDGVYWWLDCQSPELGATRLLFGLPSKSNQGFHLTIGRTY